MNWRDTDEGYWIGVVEGMEAAAGIADRCHTGEGAALRIRKAMTEGEVGKRTKKPARVASRRGKT